MGRRKKTEPYRPVGARLDESLVQSVLAGAPPGVGVLSDAADQPVHDAPPIEPTFASSARSRFSSRQKQELRREKRVLVTEQEDFDFEQLVARMGREARTNIKASHVLRACIGLLHQCDERIIQELRANRLPSRPSNGNRIALAEFEASLAELLIRGLRQNA